MDTREECKGPAPVSNGSSDGGKASRMRLAVDQPRQQQLLRPQPPRPSPPHMSPQEAHSIVQRMSSDLTMSYAQTSASLAACMQVPNPRHYVHVMTCVCRAMQHGIGDHSPTPPPHTPL